MLKKKSYTFTSPFSIIIWFIVFSLIGLYSVSKLDLNLKPDDHKNRLQISYSWPGASAENIEINATSVLESMFSRIKGIKDIRSETKESSGIITVTFDDNTDIDIARFEISSAIKNTYEKLPQGVSYPVLNDYSENNSAIIYSFTSDKPSQYVYDFSTNIISPVLRNTAGVDDIKITGWNPYITEIEYNYDLIKHIDLNGNELNAIITEHSRNRSIGMVDIVQNDSIIRPMLMSVRPIGNELAEIPIKKINGKIIQLDDIAAISHKQNSPTSLFRINGKNTISLSVYPKDDANLIKLVKSIKTKIRNTEIPDDINIINSYDASDYLKKELGLILIRTIVSLIFLLLLIYMVHRSGKLLSVVFVSLLINILTAGLLYKLINLEINIYTLAGISISLGMMIDNVLLMTDHILKSKNIKIFLAILAASLTTMAVLSFTGLYGRSTLPEISQFSFVIIINLAPMSFS